MDETSPEVIYRAEEDILIVRFGPPAPAVTLELGDGALVRVDPDTREVVALEVLNWSERTERQMPPPQPQPRRPRSHGPSPRKPILPRGLVPA